MKALSVAVVALFLVTGPAGVRTWTDNTGEYKVEAEFVDFKGGNVRLRRADNGKTVSLPLEKLSKADQEFVKSQMEPRGATAAEKVDSVEKGERGAAPAAGGAIPAELLDRLKAATVFLKTPAERCGSAFLVKKDRGVGYVVTNAHVVTNRLLGAEIAALPPVQCVFHSGTKRERSTSARVVGVDLDLDLAILKVELDTLPEPVDLDAKVAVGETLPVLIIGFPFGDMLRTSKRHPAITISRGSISSIRRDDYDRIALIQVDGGINPGNSGGPVVDAQGHLIGIAVAKVAGTQIGMAIPAEKLSEILNGRAAVAGIAVRTIEDGVASVFVSVRPIDPMGKIKSVSIHYIRDDAVKERPKPDQHGLWPRLPDAEKAELKLNGGVFVAALDIPCPGTADIVFIFQLVHESANGKLAYSEPGRFTVGLGRLGRDRRAAGKPERPTVGRPPSTAPGDAKVRQRVVDFSWNPPPINVVTPPAESAVAGRIERESSGRRYTALTAKGVTLDLGKDVLQVAACPTGKVVYVIRRGVPLVTVVDPLTWKTVTEIVVPESPTSIWADATLVAVACDKSRVVALIDAQKRSLIASGTLPELRGYTPDTVVGRAPDGSVMSLWQQDEGPWCERALVHLATDGKARIMINGEPIYWATWLLDGTGVVAQGNFAGIPTSVCGAFDLAFPQGPRQYPELHFNRLFGGLANFNINTGPAFLTSDGKALVFRRARLAAREWGNSTSGYRPDESVDGRRVYFPPFHGVPWTYLISPSFDRILREFPGSAIVELPAQQLFIAVGIIGISQRTQVKIGGMQGQPVCYYVSSTDGRVVREITLEWPRTDLEGRPQSPLPDPPHVAGRSLDHLVGRPQSPLPDPYDSDALRYDSGAVFVPGHELLLVPTQSPLRKKDLLRSGYAKQHTKLNFAYTAFRCGPVAAFDQAKTDVEGKRGETTRGRESGTGALNPLERRTPAESAPAPLADSGDKSDRGAAGEEPKLRTWRDATGAFEIEASFVTSEGGTVTLKGKDGHTIAIPLSKLSPADQAYVAGQAKKRRESGTGALNPLERSTPMESAPVPLVDSPHPLPGPASAPATKASTSPAKMEGQKTVPGQTVDLLALIDPNRDAVKGAWQRSASLLVSPDEPHARLQIPYELPEQYRLEIVVERKSGKNGVAVGLSGGGSAFIVEIDGWGCVASGLQWLDGKGGWGNETTRKGELLTTGKPSTIVCDVRRTGVRVSVDGQEIINWAGDFKRLSMHQSWAAPKRNRPFVGAYESAIVIHKLVLTSL